MPGKAVAVTSMKVAVPVSVSWFFKSTSSSPLAR
jgi:hypothetical protein